MTFSRQFAERERNVRLSASFERTNQVTASHVQRLRLEKELVGHKGCVNCIEWNSCGNLLASGSDDQCVILWSPLRHKLLQNMRTQHTANIFSVKFLPESGDRLIATAAADAKVTVIDFEQKETVNVFSCHVGRVKRLAVAPGLPAVFWSAGEDGRILQFDLRAPELNSVQNPRNVLIDLTALLGYQAEAKCLSINPCRPEQLAVGANDPYVRLFDRRMLTCTAPASSATSSSASLDMPPGEVLLPPGCARYFTAGHLPDKTYLYKRQFRALAATYVTFSPDGTGLLVNIGGEQIYLFDVTDGMPMRRQTIRDMISGASAEAESLAEGSSVTSTAAKGCSAGTAGFLRCDTANRSSKWRQPPSAPTRCRRNLSKNVLDRSESVKCRANKAFEEQRFHASIELYNEALHLNPASAILYCNRAAALMKRCWDGDIYAALSDCIEAIALDPDYVKAHYRLCKCLHALGWHKDVGDLLAYLKQRFPSHPTATGEIASIKDMEKAAADAAKAAASGAGHPNAAKASQAKRNGSRDPRDHGQAVAPLEAQWASLARDCSKRFCGHCNTTTDIKEANFFGSNGQFIVAGSDDGTFFVWDTQTTNIVRVLHGDQSIVNCLQPHPSTCLLATSGIEPVVRLWSPSPLDEDGNACIENDRVVVNSFDVASANQKRMNADPIEVMLRSMGYDLTTTRVSSRTRPRRPAAPADAASTAAGGGSSSSGGSSDQASDSQFRVRHDGHDNGGSSSSDGEEEDEITMQCRTS